MLATAQPPGHRQPPHRQEHEEVGQILPVLAIRTVGLGGPALPLHAARNRTMGAKVTDLRMGSSFRDAATGVAGMG